MGNFLGVDIGTTAIKFTVFDDKQQTVASLKKPITTYQIGEKESYQKPVEILQAFKAGVAAFREYNIQQLALSTAMHSLIPVEQLGEADIMYIWSDAQAHEVIQEFKTSPLAQVFYQRTGTPIHAMTPFAKLLYFRQLLPEWYPNVKKWIGLKEYLMYYLTGSYQIDYSSATATGLFNSSSFQWDDEIVAYLDLNLGQLPELVDTKAVFPVMTDTAAALGLQAGATVLIGASDGCLASYASYLTTGSRINLTIGTSGAIRVLTKQRQLSPKQTSFCYYLAKDLWVVGGPTNNGGNVLEWLSELLYQDKQSIFQALPEALQTSPVGAKNLSFLPYVYGERAPWWDAEKRASFEGLSVVHQQADMIRAVVEGILFNLKFIHEASVVDSGALTISGGFFDIPFVAQMTADIFQQTCCYSDYNEPTFGAVALGQSLEVKPQSKAVYQVDEHASQAYQTAYRHFKQRLLKGN